jgi:membrane protease YdiL (CAAX protease family)
MGGLLTCLNRSRNDYNLMRTFPNEIVLEQISARQPAMLLWLCLFAVPTWGPRSLAGGLMCWSVFDRFVARHYTSYSLGYFVFQEALICCAIVFLSWHYTSALWKPRPKSLRCSLKSVWILTPVLMWHLGDCFGAWQMMQVGRSLKTMAPSEFNQMLASLYQQTWEPLGCSSSADVLGYSTLSFVSPVLEEMLFSGLLGNWLARQFNFTVALVGTPICFTVVHGFAYGFSSHLLPLFFAGLTYTLMRFYSGNLLMPVLAHLAVNFVILFPKWIIAAMYFAHS